MIQMMVSYHGFHTTVHVEDKPSLPANSNSETMTVQFEELFSHDSDDSLHYCTGVHMLF